MKRLSLSLMILATVAFTSCGPGGGGSSFDKTKLKAGMTEEEVSKEFGKPNGTMTIMGKTTWTYGENEVYFKDGKTVMEGHGSMSDQLEEGFDEMSDEVKGNLDEMGNQVSDDMNGGESDDMNEDMDEMNEDVDDVYEEDDGVNEK